MPTSAPGISSRRGFTLIELLVVLLIMGMVAGLVGVMAQPDDRQRLRVEAERVAQLLDLAAVEARLTGKPVAWTADTGADGAQYRFWRWRGEAGWTEASDDTLRARRLPAGMSLSDLRIEAAQRPGGMRLEFSPDAAQAYDFQMALGSARYVVDASPLGDVQIHASR